MEENYTNFVELPNSISSSCPQANILLSSILTCSVEGKVKVNKRIQIFNQRLIDLCQTEQQIDYIDNDVHFINESGVISALFASKYVTGIHLNNDGLTGDNKMKIDYPFIRISINEMEIFQLT